MLQCGHGAAPWRTGSSRVTALPTRTGFNAATALRRGELSGPLCKPPPDCCFNAATALRRGEPYRRSPDPTQDRRASMRPRRCAVENLPARAVLTPRGTSFNAATALRRGEPVGRVARMLLTMALQCGHGAAPWRTCDVLLRSPHATEASMRPRRCAVENLEVYVLKARKLLRFNAATALRRGEPRRRPRP